MFRKLIARLWPWREINKLRIQLAEAQSAYTRLRHDNEDWYIKGRNEHYNNWLAQANMQWGSKLFSVDEKVIMRRCYEDGLNYVDALHRLAEYQFPRIATSNPQYIPRPRF